MKTTAEKFPIYSDDINEPADAGDIYNAETNTLEPCPDWETANFLLAERLDDEKSNLAKDSGGVVVAFASLGLWSGPHNGARIFGEKVNSIFDYGEDFNEWYADAEDVRGSFVHHDGRNNLVFRVAKDRDDAERLVEEIAYGGMTLDAFRAQTKSLRPAVAAVYGW